MYPDSVSTLFPIAATPTLSDYGIAYNHIARQAILQDPDWNGGKYSDEDSPNKGFRDRKDDRHGHLSHLGYAVR